MLGGLGPPNFNGGRRQILDPIFKITPISDLLSYKGSLLVQPSQRSIGERKRKRKKLLLKSRIPSATTPCGRRLNKCLIYFCYKVSLICSFLLYYNITEVGKFKVFMCLREGSKVVYSTCIISSIGIFHQYAL